MRICFEALGGIVAAIREPSAQEEFRAQYEGQWQRQTNSYFDVAGRQQLQTAIALWDAYYRETDEFDERTFTGMTLNGKPIAVSSFERAASSRYAVDRMRKLQVAMQMLEIPPAVSTSARNYVGKEIARVERAARRGQTLASLSPAMQRRLALLRDHQESGATAAEARPGTGFQVRTKSVTFSPDRT